MCVISITIIVHYLKTRKSNVLVIPYYSMTRMLLDLKQKELCKSISNGNLPFLRHVN